MKLIEFRKEKRKEKLKFLGLTLYSREIDKEEYFIKTEFLCGLITLIYNLFAKTFKLRLLNYSVFKCKLSGSYRIWYLLFLPVFYEKVCVKFLNSFLDKVITDSPEYDDYYIFPCRSGEFFLLMHHFKEWLDKNKSTNFVLVFTAKYHINICKMFFPNIPMIYVKRVNVPLISRGVTDVHFIYKDKNIYIPTYEKYFVDVEEKIKTNNAHYYELLKSHLGLSNEIIPYSINESTKQKVAKIAKYILNENFIFISPETLSNEPMEKDFWDNLVTEFKKLGYEVFCNSMDFNNLIKDTTSTFLTYEEAIELAKYAKAIIGMRSGFLECLSQNDVPLFALYTDFPKRSGFKRLKSDKVLSGFSISKLPNINRARLFEYDVNEYKCEEVIIKSILNKILK